MKTPKQKMKRVGKDTMRKNVMKSISKTMKKQVAPKNAPKKTMKSRKKTKKTKSTAVGTAVSPPKKSKAMKATIGMKTKSPSMKTKASEANQKRPPTRLQTPKKGLASADSPSKKEVPKKLKGSAALQAPSKMQSPKKVKASDDLEYCPLVGDSSSSSSSSRRSGLLRASSAGQIPGFTRREQGTWSGPFFFVQMADTQFGIADTLPPRDKNGNPKYSAQKNSELERDMIVKAVDAINRLRPAFVVLCGDMIDVYPDVEGVAAKRDWQLKTVQDCLHKVDKKIPLVCCCGNHDMGNHPNFHTIKWYREQWGHDYFSFWVRGVCCIVLNSQLYKNPGNCLEYQEEQEEWLDEILSETKAAAPKAVIAFSHISPFINEPTEPDGYFNWSEPSRTKTMNALIDVGCRSWFSGHYHRNSIGNYRSMEVVTTGAVGVNIITNPDGDPLETTGVGGGLLDDDTCGFRIVKLNKNGKVSHEWKNFSQLRNMKEVKL